MPGEKRLDGESPRKGERGDSKGNGVGKGDGASKGNGEGNGPARKGEPFLNDEALTNIRKTKSRAYLVRLIDLFLKDGSERIEEAWISGKAGDLRQVAMAVHTLGCLADNLGARC